jgi:hypothetical protein
MRLACLLVLLIPLCHVHGQRMEPDQNPYWTRYTFVEDSSALAPLKGDYHVYHLQSGMWWTYMPLDHPIHGLPEKDMRLQLLFAPEFPALRATPARGTELPDEKLVVLRDRDTMIVELSSYYEGMGSLVNFRCKTVDCDRRPPIVLPFRPGRYLPNGLSFTHDVNGKTDARTVALTAQFDVIWKKAMRDDRVIPQLNTDTCRQELVLPPDLELAGTLFRDVWATRSPYCATHLQHFPPWGPRTEYLITFNPYQPEMKKDPVTIRFTGSDDPRQWVDVSGWPVGDHPVHMVGCGNGATFTLKLR